MRQLELFNVSDFPIDPKIAPYRYLVELTKQGVRSFPVGDLLVCLMRNACLATFGDDIEVDIWRNHRLIEAHVLEPLWGRDMGMSEQYPPIIPIHTISRELTHERAIAVAQWVQSHITS